MTFKAPSPQPNFAPLYTSLANSKTQQSNNALYQTIFLLIKQVTQSRDLIIEDLNKVNTTISAILNASFMTTNDESHLFFNSRQTLPGTNITFDDSIPHQRKINATGGGVSAGAIAANSLYDSPPLHDIYENEIYTTLVNSSFGGTGATGPTGPTGAQGNMGPPGIDYDIEYIEPLAIPGPVGPVGATGATGPAGSGGGGTSMPLPPLDPEEAPMPIEMYGNFNPAAVSSSGVGGDDFAWFMGS